MPMIKEGGDAAILIWFRETEVYPSSTLKGIKVY
jgi:hypothetical protein